MGNWKPFHNNKERKTTVVVTGVTGQDGSNMCDYLLANHDIQIYGGVRRISVPNYDNIQHLKNNKNFILFNFDLSDPYSIRNAIMDIQPDYFINFAAQSFVKSSWDFPVQTFEDDALGVMHILESIRMFAPKCRFYNAGSSEEFGDVVQDMQDETHPLRPQSPYGAAKCAARHIVRVYRESYDLYAIQGWLFNHEGTRRGEEFVTRKISKGIAEFVHALETGFTARPLRLGNLEAKRDWTDSVDFMEGVWLMLNQQGEPKEYVLASGETYKIREFLENILNAAKIKFKKTGEGLSEKYFTNDGKLIVEVSEKFYRHAEVELLLGNPARAEEELGWKRKTNFKELCEKMYFNDLELLRK